ncbi:MAG: hypothetical protein U0271_27845 [Polyangiaceae bacterium]
MSIERALSAGATLVLLGWLVALASACPGSLENKQQFIDGACGDVKVQILGQRCATANCHDSSAPAGGLDLTPDADLASRIVDVDGNGCPGKIVDTSAPEDSLLYTRVLSTNKCATRMPSSGDKLTSDEEACLLEWIESL